MSEIMLTQKKSLLMKVLPVLGLCAVPMLSATATEYDAYDMSEIDMYYEAQEIQQTMEFSADDGLKYNLSGQNKEEGILSLYVDAGLGDDMDSIAQQLNNIEPSGGGGVDASIGFRFDMEF